ncbi:NAD-dependent epimerase/dehydratase family protein [Demequina mangrovi]|uniref:UDP-glucose 4-epimerase n=1 Tax=Demequina mangrovi TaxID=1043493 RepID=A0A1H7AXI5_9MICO|nr:NAD-dependent epimerase/dehydratase family protein [Demequina mangrovi]SEJ65745.1 UDP-glucose 4-epimerase [Demequina mangrovi]
MSTVYDVAVVGSGGFLGSTIAAHLTSAGAAVTGFTREDPILADDALAPRAHDVPVIVWAAGGITPTVAAEDPDAVEAELDAFRAFARAAAARPVPPRIVLLSSGGAIYGRPAVPPYAESEPPHPPNAYGAYKLAQERIVSEAGLDLTAIRIANAYGPAQRGARGQGVLAIWMREVREGRAVTLHGDGAVARDYVHADDVADLVARVIAHEAPPRVVNCGSGTPTSLADLLALLREVAGDALRVEQLPHRGVDPDSTWLDVARARNELGWEPRIALADGIADMWARTSA